MKLPAERSKTLNGFFWNFGIILCEQFRNFIVSLILARLLSPSDFGLIGMAMILSAMFGEFVDFGLGNALIQAKEITEIQTSTVFYINMGIGVLGTILMFLLAPFLAIFFHQPQITKIAMVLSLAFIVKGANGIHVALLKRDMNFRKIFVVNISSAVLSGALGIILAWRGYGVWALVYSMLSGWCITTFLFWHISSWRPHWCFRLDSVKKLWSFGYKYTLGVISSTVFSRIDTIIIGREFSAQILGLYYKALALNGLIVRNGFGALSGVLLPSMSKLQDNIEALQKQTLNIVHVTCFVTFLIQGIFILNSKEIIYILYGEKWLGAAPFFAIIGLFSFNKIIPSILADTLNATGRSDKYLKIEVIKKSCLLFGIPVAIIKGIYPYIWTVNIMEMILILLYIFALRKIGFRSSSILSAFVPYGIIFGCLCFVIGVGLPFALKTTFTPLMAIIIKSVLYTILYFLVIKCLRLSGLTILFEQVICKLRKNNQCA